MRIATLVAFIVSLSLPLALHAREAEAKAPSVKDINAFCLDFNWAGRRGFAGPGTWKDADPADHVAWYKRMGVNVIQTFCVSTNGYAWYKDGVVPEQPGLKHDFLREVVRLGHDQGMLVMGYFCIGANTRWGEENPQLSYGTPSATHLPYTDAYLAYLGAAITDAVSTTGIDGFMIDWVWQPNRVSKQNPEGKWIQAEKQLYEQLMGEPFPGEDKLSGAQDLAYSRKAIDRCWQTIHKAAKEANPDCVIWLTSNQMDHPHVVGSDMYRQADWVMAERGDLRKLMQVREMIGKDARLVTCMAQWNGQDASRAVPEAHKAGVGIYGFARPRSGNGLIKLDPIFERQVSELTGDQRNIAVLARANHGKSHHAVWDGHAFVEPQIYPPFEITFRPRGRGMQDTASLSWDADQCLAHVNSPYQSGRATLERNGEHWPQVVKVRLGRQAGRENAALLRISNGQTGLRLQLTGGHDADYGDTPVQVETNRPWKDEFFDTQDGKTTRKLAVAVTETDDYVQFALPAELTAGDPQRIVFEWQQPQ